MGLVSERLADHLTKQAALRGTHQQLQSPLPAQLLERRRGRTGDTQEGGARMAADPAGVWLTETGSSKVRIAPCGGGFCGTIISAPGKGLDAKNPETPAYKDYQKRKTRIEYAQLHSDPVRPRRLPHERADRAKARRADKVAAARAD